MTTEMNEQPTDIAPIESELPTFQEVANAFRKRCRMGRIRKVAHTPYVREKEPGEIKGKAAKKAAKKQRVKGLKKPKV